MNVIRCILGVLIFFLFLLHCFSFCYSKMGKAPAKVIGLAADFTTPFYFLPFI